MKYRVKIWRVRSTWNYFTTNPQGGGFGSSAVCSKKAIIARAIQALLPGQEYDLYNDERFEGTYKKP